MKISYKEHFVPATGIYLLSHSVGRPLTTTDDALINDFLNPWKHAGENVWPFWLECIESFRDELAILLTGQRENFCPQVNLSSALTKILQSLSVPEQRRTILYTEEDFPSIAFVLEQAKKYGFNLRAIPASENTLDAAVWAQYLTEDVGLALITHVHSNTGSQVPVADICAKARHQNIMTVVDIAQSVGVVPIDLQVWQADFVMGSCVKWLCGGPGAGFLWVDSERLAECEPTDVGWFSHENPFEFDMYNFRYAQDALRFWGGTPSVQPYVTATNSIRLINRVGVEQVRQHNLALTQRIIDATPPDILVTPSAAEQRGGTVVLDFTVDRMETVCTRLREAQVAFDVRSMGIRMSPHVYNDDSEMSVVLGAISS
ncbi:aminotransferase, class V [Luminiphilus syltensis NOR5-1B]|uniref:Aminotransferase, class V n=1 Tax=Luminiphilus syltensis NOR5-1B TaxID=565045 RepID=B8KV84_9GAMM|nr:aminotransferase class V-fold PLP-dependent enzyme [Luminiphilus syltensis]EED36987.1 aminotransferase, class V [Luminiphilus syltensis NOR5-1B]